MPRLGRLIPSIAGILLFAAWPVSSAFAAGQGGNGAPGMATAASGSELAQGWRLVRTHNPRGGADAVSIMHTADTSRSDIDLAGLMIRCRKDDAEIVVVLIRPFSVKARPLVVFGRPDSETRFKATVAAPGTAILLPRDAASLLHGPWQTLNELFIGVEDGQTKIHGVVALAGLQGAFKQLIANCPAQ